MVAPNRVDIPVDWLKGNEKVGQLSFRYIDHYFEKHPKWDAVVLGSFFLKAAQNGPPPLPTKKDRHKEK